MPNREHNRVTETAERRPSSNPDALTARPVPIPSGAALGALPSSMRLTLTDLLEGQARRAFRWYALRLRSNREFDVAAALTRKSIEVFLPTWQEKVQWSDRDHVTTRPLFPGYLFAQVAEERDMWAVLRTRGVVQVLPDSYHPMPIDEAEIETVRRVVAQKLHVRPCEYLAGDQVVIDSGPLAGVAGVVVRTRGSMHVVVSIEMLRRSVRVELDADTLIRHPDEVAA